MGTPAAFMPHTQVLGLALAVDGQPVTESHLLAWSAGVPVLGVAGDAALEAQLDGALAGTPFLAVKHSWSKGGTRSAFTDAEHAARSTRAFAERCARDWRLRAAPTLPASFTFAACIPDPALADHAAGLAGLVRQSPSVLSLAADDWNRDVVPAMYAAMRAAEHRQRELLGDFRVTAEAHLARADERLTLARRLFEEWLVREEPDWQP
jgi:hypothetical protein